MDSPDNIPVSPYVSLPVDVGGLLIGGRHPLRVQSMTNTPTTDVLSTARQVEALAKAGCELVRITARNVPEAALLGEIRKELRSRGLSIPLVADIHFSPAAAMEAVEHADKVRINPGNYIKTDPEASRERILEGITEAIGPLVRRCQELGRAIRIGVNQGSLAPYIIHEHGNTAAGMAASALDFIRVCRGLGFDRLIVSLKSSHPLTHIHAVRFLAGMMQDEGFSCPLHLGVTEAGFGTEGILRSVCGMGPLLAQGLGDTLRVSLAGDPLKEVPVALALAGHFPRQTSPQSFAHELPTRFQPPRWDPPFDRPLTLSTTRYPHVHLVRSEGAIVEPVTGIRWDESPEGPYIRSEAGRSTLTSWPAALRIIQHTDDLKEERQGPEDSATILEIVEAPASEGENLVRQAAGIAPWLMDGVLHGFSVPAGSVDWASQLLQAAGLRRSGTEIIACPSCGRSTFDLHDMALRVRLADQGLEGLKIAVMGCIVNGPGEMEDADYGILGAGPGKVSIYARGKEVERNVPDELAVEILMQVIANAQGYPGGGLKTED